MLVLGAKDNELLRIDPAKLPFEDTIFSIQLAPLFVILDDAVGYDVVIRLRDDPNDDIQI